jgi:ubiquinone/menaquinone biosynthesis C-methylase UbiE
MGRCVVRDGPRPQEARDRYDRSARRYDLVTRLLDRPRRLALERLRLSEGETALDIACGTGLNLASLRDAVGQSGRVVGVDISAGMLARAHERIRTAGWENVELIEGAVGHVELPAADAALFSFTHDVLRIPGAVASVVDALRPGGRVATAGVKYAPRWALPVNGAVRLVAPRFITTTEGLARPWSHLEERLGPLEVRSLLLGSLYVASGCRS